MNPESLLPLGSVRLRENHDVENGRSLEDISEGELRIDGRRANEMAPQDRNVAMVFQSYALYPHMSAFDNMAFGLKIQKLPADEIKRRIEDAAVVLGIDKVLDRKPGRCLVAGQRGWAAMVRRPAVYR